MLRREVITDPLQMAPVSVQARSIMPWWRRALYAVLLVGGCAVEQPEPEQVDIDTPTVVVETLDGEPAVLEDEDMPECAAWHTFTCSKGVVVEVCVPAGGCSEPVMCGGQELTVCDGDTP